MEFISIFYACSRNTFIGENLYKNVEGNFDMKIFESGVKYFK